MVGGGIRTYCDCVGGMRGRRRRRAVTRCQHFRDEYRCHVERHERRHIGRYFDVNCSYLRRAIDVRSDAWRPHQSGCVECDRLE